MNVFTMASYLVVAIVIYSVLTKVAEKNRRLNANVEKAIVALALIWPLWGEFAIVAVLAYILYRAAQKRTSYEPRGAEQ